MKAPWRLAAALTFAFAATASAKDGSEPPRSEARSFPYADGVVDLLVVGPAAKDLYDRLPGRGTTNECGATGLHKGDGPMVCVKDGQDYSCHIWLDAPKQALTEPEADDC